MAEASGRTLRVELVTPEGPLYADEARMVIVPGVMGEIGVLARHMPLTARLKPGEVRVQKDLEHWSTFATSEGFFSVSADVATVLVEDAVAANDIDVAAAREALEAAHARAEKGRAEGAPEEVVGRAERDAAFAEAQLKVARKD